MLVYGDVIGLAHILLHEFKQEVDSHIVYHERRLSSIAILFNADTRLSILNEAVAATREALGNDRPDPSSGGFVVLVPTATGDEEGS